MESGKWRVERVDGQRDRTWVWKVMIEDGRSSVEEYKLITIKCLIIHIDNVRAR